MDVFFQDGGGGVGGEIFEADDCGGIGCSVERGIAIIFIPQSYMYALVEEIVPVSVEFGGVDPGEEDGVVEIVDQFRHVHGNTDHIGSGIGENFDVVGEINGG